jgi:WD40 repeat protein
MDTSTSNGSAAAPTISVDLKLDSDEDNPRCLLKLPTGQLLAYGGDDGTISLVTFNGSKATATPVRRFDEEAVRALAVSPDGKRVAVGFDSGATQIYSYPDFEVSSSSSNHPFLPELPDPDTTTGDADEDNLFSQSDGLGGSLTVPGEKYFAGPCFDSPVRDLLFLPLSTGTGGTPSSYWLAAAWESGMCVLNATASATVTQRYLEEFAKEAYDEGGIRGLVFGSRDTNHTLTSLGMDGRLCLWDLSSDVDHPEKWKLLRRENSCCVTKRDVGEVFGADAWDRSCRPHFVQSSDNVLLAVPGATYLQLRKMSKTSPTASITVTDHDQPVVGDDKDSPHQGHIESIVTMTSSPISDDPYIITSGRDGRVVVWEIESDKVCGSERTIGCCLSFRFVVLCCCTVVSNILSLVSFVFAQEDETLTATFVRQLGQFESVPTFLLWDKDASGEERLCVACANGTLMTIQGRQHIAPTFVQKTKKVSGTKEQAKESSSQPGRLSKKKQTETIVDSDDDDENVFDEDEGAADQEIVDTPRANSNRFVEDEAADDESTADVDVVTSPTAAAIRLQATKDYDSEQEDDEDDFDIPAANTGPAFQYKTVDLPEPQPAFAPSSTPLDLARRYMCWNHIGSVTLLQGELGLSRSNVDIHFTDSAFRRPISFTDNMGFILGSLGEDGGIFATDVSDEDDLDDGEDDDFGDVVNNMSEATKAAVKRSQRNRMSKEGGSKATGSSIYFHRFETFGALRDKDWYLTLPAGERALGCACGEGWGAVITRYVAMSCIVRISPQVIVSLTHIIFIFP